jgi:cytochrome c
MKKLLGAVAALGLITASGAALAQDATAKAGCNTCHALDTKKMGPSYKDIAAKFKGKADAPKELLAKLTGGKGHPMVKAPAADVEAALKWVLSQ